MTSRMPDEALPDARRRRYHPWRDVDGVHIPDRCRVEQVAVASERGARPSRLGKCGDVVGRGGHRIEVRFDGETTVVRVWPHLVRVVGRVTS